MSSTFEPPTTPFTPGTPGSTESGQLGIMEDEGRKFTLNNAKKLLSASSKRDFDAIVNVNLKDPTAD